MRKAISIFLTFLLISGVFSIPNANATSATPMLSSELDWKYGDRGVNLEGFIPALMENTERPWELTRWTGVFRFSDGKSSTLPNYDVFNIKKKYTDDSFDKENGFGLVYRSEAALDKLFQAIYAPYKSTLKPKQWEHLREHFMSVANDPTFAPGNEFYYKVQNKRFLRTSGIVQRLGISFDQTKKVSNNERQALYTRVPFPKLHVRNDGTKMVINYEASGFTPREIRVVAVPRGGWFGPGEAKITAVRTEHIGTYKPGQAIEIESNEIAYRIGSKKDAEVDFILDDGYGHTVIVPAKLSGTDDVDFVPIKLNLTDAGQLWLEFRYDGDPIKKEQLIHADGMPMKASVKIGGEITTSFDMSVIYQELPARIEPKSSYKVKLGSINLSEPGKYFIKATAYVNNPNHKNRATEIPVKAYENNTITGEWTREIDDVDHDLIAFSVTANPKSLQTGQSTTVTASVKNLGPTPQDNVRIRFFANGKQIYEAKKHMPANKTIDVGGFAYKPTTTGVHALSVHVDPLSESIDRDRVNNIASTGCTVTANQNGGNNGNGGGGRCHNQTNKTGSWNVAYQLITGYPTKTGYYSWTDSKGTTHTSSYSYTDYNDPNWETRNVQYQERLTIDADVNTKQGIPTDPKRPKATDIESRGSWAIIPWAKQEGLAANEVTRAGYGFELKVKTNYSSDWETKVPKGYENTAKPYGTQYKGAQEVRARIYDSNNRFVDVITLDKTSDNGKQATFELPVVSYKDDVTGKTYKYRKFYTSHKAPDGKYRIEIESGPAGATGVSVCQDVFVWIHGSMYDDMQNLRVVD